MATDPNDVRQELKNPFTRKLLVDATQVASTQPNPDIRIPTLFESPEALTRVRDEISGTVDAQLAEDQQNIQDRALSQGRLRSGLTSREEIQAALNASVRRTAVLGDFELNTRQAAAQRVHDRAIQRQGAQEDAGLIEVGGEQTRANIAAQGGVDVENIKAQSAGSLAVARQQGVDAANVANIQGQTASGVATIQGRFAEAIASMQNATNIQGLEIQGQQALDQIEAQSGATLSAIAAQGVEARSTAAITFSHQLQLLTAQALEDRLTLADSTASAENIADIQAAAAKTIAAIQADTTLSVTERQTETQLAIAASDQATSISLANMAASSDLTLAEIAAETNLSIADINRITDAYRVDAQSTIAMSRLSVEQRLAAVEELRQASDAAVAGAQVEISANAQAAQENIGLLRLSLDQKAQDQGFQVARAQVTGIWEEYGPQQLEEFNSSFQASFGDENYNVEYDFNGDGTVGYNDFLTFSQLAAVGGTTTLAAQQLRESTRQFDISQENQWDQFILNLDAQIESGNLDRDQAFALTLATLEANTLIQAEGINVQQMAVMASMLTGDGALAMTNEDRKAAIDFIMGFETNLKDFVFPDPGPTLSDTEQEAVTEAQLGTTNPEILSQAQTIAQQITTGGWASASGGSVDISDTFDLMISIVNEQEPGGRETIMTHFDINGDGILNEDDKVLALAFG
jgi:hypothetical protein